LVEKKLTRVQPQHTIYAMEGSHRVEANFLPGLNGCPRVPLILWPMLEKPIHKAVIFIYLNQKVIPPATVAGIGERVVIESFLPVFVPSFEFAVETKIFMFCNMAYGSLFLFNNFLLFFLTKVAVSVSKLVSEVLVSS
jgi:hypothetical protein